MITQLFCQNNYRCYNISLAKIFGLQAAVYLNEILFYFNENKEDEVVHLNREEIENNTTLSISEQKSIDKIFKEVQLVDINEDDGIRLNYGILIGLFDEQNKKIVSDIPKSIKKKRTKTEAIRDELRKCIKSDNAELRDAYSDWIDAVLAKEGWMSKRAVEVGQKTVDSYSNHNLDTALELLNIASINGYRDIQWAVNAYEKCDKGSKIPSKNVGNKEVFQKKQVLLSQEVF